MTTTTKANTKANTKAAGRIDEFGESLRLLCNGKWIAEWDNSVGVELAGKAELLFGLIVLGTGGNEYRPAPRFEKVDSLKARRLFVRRGRGAKPNFVEIEYGPDGDHANQIDWERGVVMTPVAILKTQVGAWPGGWPWAGRRKPKLTTEGTGTETQEQGEVPLASEDDMRRRLEAEEAEEALEAKQALEAQETPGEAEGGEAVEAKPRIGLSEDLLAKLAGAVGAVGAVEEPVVGEGEYMETPSYQAEGGEAEGGERPLTPSEAAAAAELIEGLAVIACEMEAEASTPEAKAGLSEPVEASPWSALPYLPTGGEAEKAVYPMVYPKAAAVAEAAASGEVLFYRTGTGKKRRYVKVVGEAAAARWAEGDTLYRRVSGKYVVVA